MTEPAEPAAARTVTEKVQAVVERRGVTTSFAWGFSEATLFFLVPDIAVGAVALFGLKRGLKAAAAAVAGAVLGGLALYAVVRLGATGVRDVLDRLPGIPARFFAEVRTGVAQDGGTAIVAAPGRGIPYKLYAAEWAVADRGALALAFWTVVARAGRIVPAALVAWAGARVWRRVLGDRRTGLLLTCYAAVWATVYAFYFASVGF